MKTMPSVEGPKVGGGGSSPDVVVSKLVVPNGNGHENGNGSNGNGRAANGPTAGRKHGGRGSENGFEAWGGYMGAKKAKLDVQLNSKPEGRNGHSGESSSIIFSGISVWINGYTDPPEPELKKLFVLHGGTIHAYRTSSTQYVIATNLCDASKRLYGQISVKPQWITDSIKASTLLNYRDYRLFDYNRENKQPTVSQFFKNGFKNGAPHTVTSNNASEKSDDLEVATLIHVNGKTGDENNAETHGLFSSPSQEVVEKQKAVDDVYTFSDGDESNDKTVRPLTPRKVYSGPGSAAAVVVEELGTKGKVKLATEEGFLEAFFKNSRLHLISDQKKEMQNKIGHLRKNIEGHKFPLIKEFEEEVDVDVEPGVDHSVNHNTVSKTLMHIDLDCFFVSVGLLSRPHLRGRPVVVTHSSGKGDAKSDIASASYEARKFGVRNGMWVSEAKQLCPQLEFIPYDFKEYRRVSEKFFDTIAGITLDIEAGSVDEMTIDATPVLRQIPGATPLHLAEFIREKVFDAIECSASIGIGSNKLLAKIATNKAKPSLNASSDSDTNGVFHLQDEDVKEFMKMLPVRDLPGVGRAHETKLKETFGVGLCKELLEIPALQLKRVFGPMNGERMIQLCQGMDSAELKYGFERPKSISVDVNYGIRFQTEEQLSDFFKKLCEELSSRVTRAQALGLSLSLKIMVRRKDAGEPIKYGGHGLVNTLTKSVKFMQPSKSWEEFYRATMRISKALQTPPSDYRGIGLSLTELSFEFDKSENEKRKVQKTLSFPFSGFRGRQMLDSVKKHLGFGTFRTPGPTRKLDVSPPKQQQPEQASNQSEPIDVNVLKELPEDIALEIAKQYGIDLDSVRRSPQPSPETSLVILDSPSKEEPKVNSVNVPKNGIGNPYEEIDQIDRTYLAALPDSIRNEVLLQFQEAKGRKAAAGGSNEAANDSSDPQPCSSRHLVEQDSVLRNKKPIQSKEQSYRVPTPVKQPSPRRFVPQPKVKKRPPPLILQKPPSPSSPSLHCNEQMCEEIVYTTPPQITPPPTSFNQSRIQSRKSSTSSATSRRRLDFNQVQTLSVNPTPTSVPDVDVEMEMEMEMEEPFDLQEFWNDSNSMFSRIPSLNSKRAVSLPVINGMTDLDDVRKYMRNTITFSYPKPEMVEQWKTYLDELTKRGYLTQIHCMFKFLYRKHQALVEDSPWKNIIETFISSIQRDVAQQFNSELALDDL